LGQSHQQLPGATTLLCGTEVRDCGGEQSGNTVQLIPPSPPIDGHTQFTIAGCSWLPLWKASLSGWWKITIRP